MSEHAKGLCVVRQRPFVVKSILVRNLDTGEIYDEMTEDEMREFDGDIEEPQDIDDEPEDSFDATAFDKTALCKLDAIFGDKLALR